MAKARVVGLIECGSLTIVFYLETVRNILCCRQRAAPRFSIILPARGNRRKCIAGDKFLVPLFKVLYFRAYEHSASMWLGVAVTPLNFGLLVAVRWETPSALPGVSHKIMRSAAYHVWREAVAPVANICYDSCKSEKADERIQNAEHRRHLHRTTIIRFHACDIMTSSILSRWSQTFKVSVMRMAEKVHAWGID